MKITLTIFALAAVVLAAPVPQGTYGDYGESLLPFILLTICLPHVVAILLMLQTSLTSSMTSPILE